jgi:hypothetical protein
MGLNLFKRAEKSKKHNEITSIRSKSIANLFDFHFSSTFQESLVSIYLTIRGIEINKFVSVFNRNKLTCSVRTVQQ